MSAWKDIVDHLNSKPIGTEFTGIDLYPHGMAATISYMRRLEKANYVTKIENSKWKTTGLIPNTLKSRPYDNQATTETWDDPG
jgi:hypothetical protein